jgi:hypothetical protein
MSDTAHAYELPADQTVPADAVREAAGGEVVFSPAMEHRSPPWSRSTPQSTWRPSRTLPT